LLAHLILFGFIYPGERDKIPDAVFDELVARLRAEPNIPSDANLCRGTLLSRSQYLHDVDDLGFIDAPFAPVGAMTAEETARRPERLRPPCRTMPRQVCTSLPAACVPRAVPRAGSVPRHSGTRRPARRAKWPGWNMPSARPSYARAGSYRGWVTCPAKSPSLV